MEAKNFDHLLGTSGFSDALLKNHFSLYQGYVKNVQTIGEEMLALKHAGKTGMPSFAELRRRYGWEYNGVRLHEYYFGNLAKTAKAFPVDSPLAAKINECFGSYEEWEKDFRAVGAMRGIGWVVLYFDPAYANLVNVWINEHDVGHLAGAVPLLILDVFEHAYTLDYGIKKGDYVDAFFRAIDWGEVNRRIDIRK